MVGGETQDVFGPVTDQAVAMSPQAGTSMWPRGRLVRWIPEIAILLLLALLTLNRLDAADVCGGNEAAMAVYVQQMIEHKQFIFPLDNCRIPMYKPPLYHWTATALAAVLRQPTTTSFVLRLPSALYAIAAAAITIIFARSVVGKRAGILSGLILCGSYQYISDARVGLVDMTLTFFITLALLAFFEWFIAHLETPRNSFRAAFFLYSLSLALGLGVLAKGPVGLILPAAAIAVFLVTEEAWGAFAQLFRFGPILIVLTMGSSWYLTCLFEHHLDFLRLQLGTENFGRFFGGLGRMTSWYYLRPLLFNSIPFSLFVPLAVIAGLRGRRPLISRSATSGVRLQRAELAARFLAIFWVCTLTFFELAAYKRRTYLLPLWPASAVLLAWSLLDRVLPRLGECRGTFVYRTVAGICVAVAAANFFFIPAYELHKCGAPLNLSAIVREMGIGSRSGSSSGLTQTESYRQPARRINSLTSSEGPLYVIGIESALEPLVFYLNRCVIPLRSLDGAPPGYIIMSATVWSKVSRNSHLALLGRFAHNDGDLVLVRSDPQPAG